jgi:hypothetical protein
VVMDRLIQANVRGEKTIVLSEHREGKDIAIANALDIEIVNVSCVASAMFINHLQVGDPIPDIDVKQDQISVIYVYFPLGEGDAYLTTNEWAEKIRCYAPYNWGVEQAYDKAYGVYFKLYPLSDYDLEPREKLYISISNVVSFGQLEKMVYVAVRFTSIPMSDDATSQTMNDSSDDELAGTDFLAYFKKRSPLSIINFSCNRTKVAVGDSVTFSWEVVGDAVSCVLTPGDLIVNNVGSMELEVSNDTIFRLYAIGENEQITRTATVYVDNPVIQSFTSDCVDHKTKYGQPIQLSYEVKDGYNLYLNEGIGRVSGNTIAVVPKKAKPTYTLSCLGTKGLVQESITITVTDYLLVNWVIFTRSRQVDGSYKYYLNWDVENFITITLTTSDGQVRSSDKGSGTINFTSREADLTVLLQCTGSAGQVINQMYKYD